MAFNREKFELMFIASLDMLANAEAVTKRELRALSRSVLEAVHVTENIGYVNQLMAVLTPVNKKVARHYFTHFTGFHFDDGLDRYTKKNKGVYAQAKKLSEEFLAEPHNNIWTWADRNIEIEPKPFDADKVAQYIAGALKKASGCGKGHKDVVLAIMKGGITVDDLMAVLNMAADQPAEQPAPKAEEFPEALM